MQSCVMLDAKSETASRLPSREFGLILGFILGRFCFKMEDLHYGFWTDNLPIEPQNVAKAQTQYTEFLLSHIPQGVETILDVGCGTGNTARKLLDCGYHVDCVSPNPFLTEHSRNTLGDRVTFFECRFEDLQTDKRYDLLLFSESFLFMHPETALSKIMELLKGGGHLLLSDLFKIVPDGQTAIGGGQHLSQFYETISRFPFKQVKDIDVTSRMAPTFTLLDNAYREAIKPAYDLVIARLRTRYPWAMRLLLWKFGTTIRKYENKHFSGQRTAETFARIKSYRVFLYRKI
jgi:SAM-dependent methyltransferase